MSFELRKFLLATGDRALGPEYVERLSAYDFERLWVMMQLVNQASTPEGRKNLDLDVGVSEAESIEAGEKQAVDPSQMSPAELEQWAKQWYTSYYEGGEP